MNEAKQFYHQLLMKAGGRQNKIVGNIGILTRMRNGFMPALKTVIKLMIDNGIPSIHLKTETTELIIEIK